MKVIDKLIELYYQKVPGVSMAEFIGITDDELQAYVDEGRIPDGKPGLGVEYVTPKYVPPRVGPTGPAGPA